MTIEKLKLTRSKKRLPSATLTTTANKDPFPYGWRYIIETTPDGKQTYRQVALTQADFLNPQLGDQMIQNTKHFQLMKDFAVMLEIRYQADETMAVFADLKMIWGINGLSEPAPDIAVVPNIKNKAADRNSFKVKEEGTRPCLIIEIVSPNYPGDDTDKVEIYAKAGIAEYFTIDPYFGDELLESRVTGYRLIGGRYEKMQPNKAGYLLSETTGLYFGLTADKRSVVLVDVFTEQRLLRPHEIEKARLQAEKAHLKAEAKAEAEADRAAKLEARVKELEAKLQYPSEKG